jgi:hypothetical protein
LVKGTLDRFTRNAGFGDKPTKLLARSLARHEYERSRVILSTPNSEAIAVDLTLASKKNPGNVTLSFDRFRKTNHSTFEVVESSQ